MKVSLKDYPSATEAIIPLIFTNRECAPLSFTFSLPGKLAMSNEIKILTGDTHPDISISALQIPCSFVQNYTVALNSGVELPDFMSFSATEGVIKFSTAEQRHISIYNVTLKSQLVSEHSNTVETWFNIIISPKPNQSETL